MKLRETRSSDITLHFVKVSNGWYNFIMLVFTVTLFPTLGAWASNSSWSFHNL
jgi:hypothetical protein